VLKRTDGTYEEVARTLGDSQGRALRRVVLPLLVPAVATGALLATLYALSDFGSVSLLQFDSFARQIYVQYRAAFDRSLAAVLALGLAGLALGAALVEAFVRHRRPRVVARTGSRPAAPVALGRWRWPALTACASVTGLALVLPVLTLVAWLWRGLVRDDLVRVLPETVANTALAGVGAALVALLLGLPVALLAARWPRPSVRLIEAGSVTSFALPGIVVALAVVFLAIRIGPVVYQTLGLLLVAYAVRFLPLAIVPLREGLVSISPRLEESARLLGRTPLQAFRDVALPILRPGLVAGAALVFLSTIKELPMTLLLGPTEFRTLATSVWGAVGDGFYARAAAPALVLVIVSIAGVGLLLREEDHA
jgi:iron(III) transport system permease protein